MEARDYSERALVVCARLEVHETLYGERYGPLGFTRVHIPMESTTPALLRI